MSNPTLIPFPSSLAANAMVLKFPNTSLVLRPAFTGKSTFLSIVGLKSKRVDVISSEDYLASSLSEAALAISKGKPCAILSTARADSVVALFSEFGFCDTHIAKVFSARPRLLTYSPTNTLKPKLDFLSRSGISGDALVHIITADPRILERSLHKQIIPCVNLLNTFFPGRRDPPALASFLSHKRAAAIFRNFQESTTPANVATLRRRRVPDSSILRLALMGGGPATLSRDPGQFAGILTELEDMGLDPKGKMFPYGIKTYSGLSKEKWASKMDVVKKCLGWSNDQQVLALFIKHCNLMTVSEEKLRQGLEILTNRLGWTPEYIAKYPTLLTCSINNRILPRISVLEILLSKGLVEKALNGNAFLISEDSFLRLYVDKYQQDMPQVQLMEIYAQTMNM